MKVLEKQQVIRYSGQIHPLPLDVYEHNKRVSMMVLNLSKIIGLEKRECNINQIGAMNHDIGKALIPQQILYKEKLLTIAEMEVLQEHSNLSYLIMKEKGIPEEICILAKCHHENYDGTGYPMSLKGEEIPIGARIIRICDFYDALTNDRVYQKKVAPREAIRIMEENKRFLDLNILNVFKEMMLRVEIQKRSIII